MSGLYLSTGLFPHKFLQPTAEYILQVQTGQGAIPWFTGHHLDPWDHVEAAMGLDVCGEHEAARRAYYWLRDCQLPAGNWWASYGPGETRKSAHTETNFCAYIATGTWHHYLVTGELRFLEAMWPTVQGAINFVLALQHERGEIPWAVDADGRPANDALLTGCSSIAKSLDCALAIARLMGEPVRDWHRARSRLRSAIRLRPERFDRHWDSKSRFAMDWYYPVLCGILRGAEARARIAGHWQEFVVPGLGCRCVRDEPWIAVAESCELVMALLTAGERARALELYSWLHRWRTTDGAYWTGYQYRLQIPWPHEKTTWTAAAVLLAADALTAHTAASGLFTRPVVALPDHLDEADVSAGLSRDGAAIPSS